MQWKPEGLRVQTSPVASKHLRLWQTAASACEAVGMFTRLPTLLTDIWGQQKQIKIAFTKKLGAE
jgi:hypothetical protein